MKGKNQADAPHVPEGVRLYAIGDIHGRDDLLAFLLAHIEGERAAAPELRHILIFLGDYVDRGLQSRQVLDRLTQDMPGFERVFLKGNHELAMLQFLEDPAFGKSWRHYGGVETLHSYGVTDTTLSESGDELTRARDALKAALPEKHFLFLRGLQLFAEFGAYYFAHAGVRPGIPLHHQVEDDLLWIRDEFLESDQSFGKIVVHGHTPREEIVIRRNRIGVDTGAYMTGVLTALVLEGASRRFLQTSAGRGVTSRIL